MEEIKPRNVLLVVLWTYLLYALMHIYQYVGAIIAAQRAGQSFDSIMSGKFESVEIDIVVSLAALIIGVPLVFLVARFLWGRSFAWMRLPFNFGQLLFGLALGLLLPFVVLQILNFLGVAKISWGPVKLQSTEVMILIGYACFAVFSGVAEEVVFRGMAAREFALKYGWIIAVIIGGVYFGAAHLLTKLREITIADALWVILAGTVVSALFVALYIRSGSLWLPIGFHMAWNFCLKGIMGITMSGNEAQVGLLDVELFGHRLLTGGGFGMEASIVSLGVYLLVAFLFLYVPWNGTVELLSNQ